MMIIRGFPFVNITMLRNISVRLYPFHPGLFLDWYCQWFFSYLFGYYWFWSYPGIGKTEEFSTNILQNILFLSCLIVQELDFHHHLIMTLWTLLIVLTVDSNLNVPDFEHVELWKIKIIQIARISQTMNWNWTSNLKNLPKMT